MGNTIYVLNFIDHSFTTHDFMEDAGDRVKELFSNGADYSEIEVIICFDGDESRMDGNEFLRKWCE